MSATYYIGEDVVIDFELNFSPVPQAIRPDLSQLSYRLIGKTVPSKPDATAVFDVTSLQVLSSDQANGLVALRAIVPGMATAPLKPTNAQAKQVQIELELLGLITGERERVLLRSQLVLSTDRIADAVVT